MIPILMLAAAVQCHVVTGDRILGSDLAAASPLLASLPPGLTIGNAPQPGARRFFEAEELARIARNSGITGSGFETVCLERLTEPLAPARIIEAMRKTLGVPGAEIEILDQSKFPVPRGELVFPRELLPQPGSGDSAIWNGYVDYSGGRFTVWASVRLRVPAHRVVAVYDLKQGHLVTPEDVRSEEAMEFPPRVASLTSAAAATGQEARRFIRAGTPLLATDLVQPNDIERGQTVTVEVRSGAAVLRMEATAVTAGRRGDTVALRNSTSGKTFQARVEEPGRAVLELLPSETEVPQ